MTIKQMLETAADIQSFFDPKDRLSSLIYMAGTAADSEGELDILELDMISAAGTTSYSRFMEKMRERGVHAPFER